MFISPINSIYSKNYSYPYDRNNFKKETRAAINSCFASDVGLYGIVEIKKNAYLLHRLNNYNGCLIGGAIGDALGSPVEFMNLREIKKEYGQNGVEDLINGESGKAEISDDTQMTIFTIDGLLKSIGEKFNINELPDVNTIYDSYMDWLKTQMSDFGAGDEKNGWVSNIVGLYGKRNPGNTCISALMSGKTGTVSEPINNSKGNGGVMRVAPVGLLYYKKPAMAFAVGNLCAAITHGNPSGYLSAGFLSSMIAFIVKGESLENAVDKSLKILKKYDEHEEVEDAINKAKELAKTNIEPSMAIKKIGGGWVAEQALAIAVYCALKSPDNFENAIKMSVNHDGDSDSTGAITGNIMGLYLGENKIPEKWKKQIELNKELKILAHDIYIAPDKMIHIKSRYPSNKGHIPNWYRKQQDIKITPSYLNYVSFLPEDEKLMQTMSPKEIIEYKKYLLKNKLYNINN